MFFYHFYVMFRLKSNPAKTEVYCGGLSMDEAQELARLNLFKLGQLPVRYLGIP